MLSLYLRCTLHPSATGKTHFGAMPALQRVRTFAPAPVNGYAIFVSMSQLEEFHSLQTVCTQSYGSEKKPFLIVHLWLHAVNNFASALSL